MSVNTTTCTNCTSRLRLHEPSQTDRVFACPKCGAMVVVEGDKPGNDRARWRQRKRPPRTGALLHVTYDAVNEILDRPPVTVASLAAASTGTERAILQDEEPSDSTPEIEVGNASVRKKRENPWAISIALIIGASLAVFAVQKIKANSSHDKSDDNVVEVTALKPVIVPAQKQQLATKLQSSAPTVPNSASLLEFTRILGQAFEVPVTIDIDQLKYCRASINTQISSSSTGLTAAELIRESLQPLRLIARSSPGGIRITTDEDTALQARAHDVSDLVTDEPQLLVQLVRDFVCPAMWQDNGGAGSLVLNDHVLNVHQSRDVHLELHGFLNRLRAARGLPHGSTVELQHSRRTEQLLAGKCLCGVDRPCDWSRALVAIERSSACQLLVDWDAIHDAGISLPTEIAPLQGEATLESHLLHLTSAHGMTFRGIGSQAFEITSAVAERNANVIQLHPLKNGAALDELQRFVNSFELPSVSGKRLGLDPVSNTLVARLPWTAQRALVEFIGRSEQ